MTSSSNSNVAIIVPTWQNRSDLWLNLLDYYTNLGSSHGVYVGDSTEYAHPEEIHTTVGRFDGRIKVSYITLPGMNDTEAISELLNTANEPYAAFCGDDDFLVPSSLDTCAQYLKNNPEYSAIHGIAAVFDINPNANNGPIVATARYGLRFVDAESGSGRLTEYLANFFETLFSVHRTAQFRSDVAESLSLTDRHFRDLLICCLTVIRGKVKQLDCFYLVRQIHSRQFLAPDAFDWVTRTHWATDFQWFSDRLSKELVQQDGISMEEARGVVKTAFWTYLARGIARDRDAKYRAKDTGLTGVIRRTPWMHRSARKIRSFLPRQDTQMSLNALLRPSSPHHSEFMPVYSAISEGKSDGRTSGA